VKKITVFFLTFSSAGVVFAGPESYEFGLSDPDSNIRYETVTEQLLEQQRNSTPPKESELPAQLYVDSQRRISDSFKISIPESLQEKANSMKESN